MDAKQAILILEKKGIRQADIAKATGLSQATISLIRNDKRKAIKHTTHVRLLDLLNECSDEDSSSTLKIRR